MAKIVQYNRIEKDIMSSTDMMSWRFVILLRYTFQPYFRSRVFPFRKSQEGSMPSFLRGVRCLFAIGFPEIFSGWHRGLNRCESSVFVESCVLVFAAAHFCLPFMPHPFIVCVHRFQLLINCRRTADRLHECYGGEG